MNNNQLNQFQIFDDLKDDQISQFHSALKEVMIDKGKKIYYGRRAGRLHISIIKW